MSKFLGQATTTQNTAKYYGKGFNDGFYVGILVKTFQQESSATNDTKLFQDKVIAGKLQALPSDDYELIQDIIFTYEFVDDEVLAIIPELELYGEGNTQLEALEDLQLELLDLADEIYSIPDENLGKYPKMWKQILRKTIKKCP